MSARPIRENYIPLRKDELVDALCADRDLPAAERESFRACCQAAADISISLAGPDASPRSLRR